MSEDGIPHGRVRRGARFALAARHRRSSTQLAGTLGAMKGGAMKLGQLASFVDLDFVPLEYRDVYQGELAALRDSAPPMAWPTVRAVLEDAWGAAPESVCEDFSEEPAAAASIGQVHRARLAGGREVAVKVQYPGVAQALEDDIGAVLPFLTIGRSVFRGVDARAVGAELRARLLEELDYELEARRQNLFASAYRDHPLIHVPLALPELTRPRVLVSEWVEGAPFETVRGLARPARDRYGEILVRFYSGSGAVIGLLNTDPHPGNHFLLPDGRVAFVDFGSVRQQELTRLAPTRALTEAYQRGDAAGVLAQMRTLGYVEDGDEVDAVALTRFVGVTQGWYLEDREITLDADYVQRASAELVGSNGELLALLRRLRLPPPMLMFLRLAIGLGAVLAQLEATANWYRLMTGED